MTNRRVTEWLDNYRLKCQDITDNREYIDGSLSLPEAYERHNLSFPISPEDVEKLQEILDSMCNGLKTTREQGQLAHFHLSREVETCLVAR